MGILDFLESIIPGFSGNQTPAPKPQVPFDQQMAAKGWHKMPNGTYYQGGNSPTINPDLGATPQPQPTNTPVANPPIAVTPQPLPTAPPPTLNRSGWNSKYQDLYSRYTKSLGVDPNVVKLLVTSENGKENPNFINSNNNGTQDVGLLQVNVPQNDMSKAEMLKDPATNIQAGLGIYKQRLQNLGDPLLALASYNLGAGGAISNPKQALQRAVHIYQNAGLPIPNSAFAQDPIGFVNARMNQYKQLGLVSS